MPRTGAHLVVEALAAAGVHRLFSLSGNQILSLYDAALDRGVTVLHTRHEAAAVHMADAWGRLTEEPAVALVTAGPGHCNAISALYTALMSESPVVLLSGHAPAGQLGRGAFQEIEQAAVAAPVTKASWTAKDATRLGEDIRTALELARSGRPGPVHVSLPGDLLEAAVGEVTVSPGPGPGRDAPIAAPAESVERALALLASASRPFIVLGPAMARGTRRAAVARLAEVTGAPALPMESPRGFNDPWLHLAAPLLGQADLLLLLGKKPDFVVRYAQAPAFAAGCRVIQVDADAAAVRPGALGIVADPAVVADQLATAARGRTWRHHAWGQEVERARATVPAAWAAARESSRTPIHPLRVAAAIQRRVDRGALLVADGGEFGQWIQAGVETGPPRLFNGPAGGIGGAIPMALAARLRHPDRPVIAALGDGTFGFHAFELDTAVRYRLPVVVVIGNDARWNAEHQLQIQHYGADRTVGCELLPSRYEDVAVALGGFGERIERAADLEPALERALGSGLPAVVNVLIDGLPAPTYGPSPSH